MKAPDDDNIDYIFIRIPTEMQVEQITDLYRAQGWWEDGEEERDEQLIAKLIAGSHCFAIATDGRSILGMGRAISDGVSDAYIQDLTVRKDFRNIGIGRRLLQALLKRLQEDGIPWIGLIAEPGSFNLYYRAGFREMQNSTPMLLSKES